MAKLIQIGSSIMNKLRGGPQSDDNKIDWELVYDEIHKCRSVVMWEDFRQAKKIDDSFYQIVRCIKTDCRPLICEGIDSGDSEFYAVLPKIIEIDGTALIKYFGTVDLQLPFNKKDILGKLFSKADVYGTRVPNYAIVGQEALIDNPPSCAFEYAGLVAVLDNPVATGCKKDYLEEEYPLPSRLIGRTEAFVLTNLAPMLNIDNEAINNARDEIFGAGKPNNNNRR